MSTIFLQFAFDKMYTHFFRWFSPVFSVILVNTGLNVLLLIANEFLHTVVFLYSVSNGFTFVPRPDNLLQCVHTNPKSDENSWGSFKKLNKMPCVTSETSQFGIAVMLTLKIIIRFGLIKLLREKIKPECFSRYFQNAYTYSYYKQHKQKPILLNQRLCKDLFL